LAPLSRLATALPATAALLLLLWVASFNLDRYFNLMPRDPRVVAAFAPAESLIGREASKLPPETEIFVDPLYLGRPSRHAVMRFLAPAAEYKPLTSLEEEVVPAAAGEVAVFLSADSAELAKPVVRQYPSATIVELEGPPNSGVLVYFLRIPSATAERLTHTPASDPTGLNI